MQACKACKILPFGVSDKLLPFLSKIYQWKVAINCRFEEGDTNKPAGKQLFEVVKDGQNTHVNHFTSKNFDCLNLGYFDRVSRHQIVVEVARFIMPLFFATDPVITRDKRHHFYLTQMLLTVKGGVEFAIMLLA